MDSLPEFRLRLLPVTVQRDVSGLRQATLVVRNPCHYAPTAEERIYSDLAISRSDLESILAKICFPAKFLYDKSNKKNYQVYCASDIQILGGCTKTTSAEGP